MVQIPQTARIVAFHPPGAGRILHGEIIRRSSEKGEVFIRTEHQTDVVKHRGFDALINIQTVAARSAFTVPNAKMPHDRVVPLNQHSAALQPHAVARCRLSGNGDVIRNLEIGI